MITLDLSSAEHLQSNLASVRSLLEDDRWVKRLLEGDTSLWPVGNVSSTRLGWLQDPEETLLSEADSALSRCVVVLGMGGSSLAPQVIGNTLPLPRPMFVLDDIAPRALRLMHKRTRALGPRLITISSKSGGTLEPNLMADYFLQNAAYDDRFVVITDPGSSLEERANKSGMEVVSGEPNVGGRYSALSPFGAAPTSFAGGYQATSLLRTSALAQRKALTNATSHYVESQTHHWPKLLASALVSLERQNVNTLLIVATPMWALFAKWLEQLISESLGKANRGLIPVVCTPKEAAILGEREDCAILQLGHVAPLPAKLPRLVFGGLLPEDLGAAFYGWMVAVSLAGAGMGIDPFDEPDVAVAKAKARDVLNGSLHVSITDTPKEAREKFALSLDGARYGAVMSFGSQTYESNLELRTYVHQLRLSSKVPIVLAQGPSYLHSLGQLFKGGVAGGTFLVVRSSKDKHADVLLNQAESLLDAQSQGDFQALLERGRSAFYAAG